MTCLLQSDDFVGFMINQALNQAASGLDVAQRSWLAE